jgi:hypothetical protein
MFHRFRYDDAPTQWVCQYADGQGGTSNHALATWSLTLSQVAFCQTSVLS